MVLVAPRPTVRPVPRGAGAGAGGEVLALLRGGGGTRPCFDPGLAGGLRAWLEDAAFEAASARGDGAVPLVLGPRRLLGSTGGPGGPGEPGEEDDGMPSDELVLSRVVHALFRQLVNVGTLDDPLDDSLEALRAEGERSGEVVRHIEALTGPARAALCDAVMLHADHLLALVPRLAPGWLPRTDDRVSVPLAGGRIVLQGVFDLLIGVPAAGRASLCAMAVSTGGPWPKERRSLHYLALLETLRSGTPPFRLALLESASGRYGVEDVREEHLVAMASHVAAWLVAGGGGGAASG
jgi:hypothetical protein